MSHPPPPREWVAPTLRDRLLLDESARAVREAARLDRLARKVPSAVPVAHDADLIPEPPVPLRVAQRCRCRRMATPAELLDVRGVDPAITGGADYLCTSCVGGMIRSGVLDPVELARAQGAPAEWLVWREAKKRARVDAQKPAD